MCSLEHLCPIEVTGFLSFSVWNINVLGSKSDSLGKSNGFSENIVCKRHFQSSIYCSLVDSSTSLVAYEIWGWSTSNPHILNVPYCQKIKWNKKNYTTRMVTNCKKKIMNFFAITSVHMLHCILSWDWIKFCLSNTECLFLYTKQVKKKQPQINKFIKCLCLNWVLKYVKYRTI